MPGKKAPPSKGQTTQGNMKAIALLIIIGSSMLLMSVCSKAEPAVDPPHICGEGCFEKSSQMPAFDKKDFLKQWEKKKSHE